jgi:hypothetical protein
MIRIVRIELRATQGSALGKRGVISGIDCAMLKRRAPSQPRSLRPRVTATGPCTPDSPASAPASIRAGDALARLMGQSGNKMETLTPEMGQNEVPNIRQVVDFNDFGEVAERLNAPVLKTGGPLRGS